MKHVILISSVVLMLSLIGLSTSSKLAALEEMDGTFAALPCYVIGADPNVPCGEGCTGTYTRWVSTGPGSSSCMTLYSQRATRARWANFGYRRLAISSSVAGSC